MKKILNEFEGFVLAGGKSSRMKTDKAFLKIGRKTFLENAVEILKPNCRQVKMVLNKLQTHFIEKLPENTEYIFDHFENRGALGGIHAALKNCESEFAVILAVDLPFVTSEMIEKLCEIALNSKGFSVIVPRQNDGRLQPLCAIYRVKECLPKLEDLLNPNISASVRDFLKLVPTIYVENNELGSKDLFFNVNHPTEFQKLFSPNK